MTDHNADLGGSAVATETLSAFFDSRTEAERAVASLRSNGIAEGSIRLTEGSERAAGETTERPAEESKGFFESLGDMLFPDEDRNAYAEGLSRGGYLVSVVNLTAEQRETALDILDDEGAIDLDERESAWRAEGWSGSVGTPTSGAGAAALGAGMSSSSASASASSETGAASSMFTESDRTMSEDEVIPVIEERLRVGKRDASHGRVRVRSYVRETPVEENVELTSERVEIERRPVDRAVSSTEDAFRERSIEAEESAEEAVVSKEARVVEEVSLRRERETHTETVSDTERRTEVEIEDERTGVAGAPLSRS